MQLLAMRRIVESRDKGTEIRVLYLVTTEQWRIRSVIDLVYWDWVGSQRREAMDQHYDVTDYARNELGLEETSVIDPDARGANPSLPI